METTFFSFPFESFPSLNFSRIRNSKLSSIEREREKAKKKQLTVEKEKWTDTQAHLNVLHGQVIGIEMLINRSISIINTGQD